MPNRMAVDGPESFLAGFPAKRIEGRFRKNEFNAGQYFFSSCISLWILPHRRQELSSNESPDSVPESRTRYLFHRLTPLNSSNKRRKAYQREEARAYMLGCSFIRASP